jgi:lambda family phage tail tape measure protein
MAATNEKIKFELTASDQTSQAFNAILGRLDAVDQSAKKTSASFSGLGNTLNSAFAGISAGAVVKQMIGLSDTFTNLTSRLGLVVAGTQNLNSVQQDLFNISQQTRNPLEATTDLYTRLARSTQHLGTSQGALLSVTNTVSKALTISGGSVQSTSAAMVQLAQGLQSGQLRGQELNSVLEQTPRVAQAIADGLKMTIGQLRQYAEEGKLSADSVIGALLSQKDIVDKEFGRMNVTVGQAIQTVSNSMQMFVGKVNDSTGATSSLSKMITDVAEKIGNLHNSVKGFEPTIISVIAGITAFATSGAVIAGISAIGAAIAGISAPILAIGGAVASIVGYLTYVSTKKFAEKNDAALALLKGVDTSAEDARLARQRNIVPVISPEDKKRAEKLKDFLKDLRDKTNDILYGKSFNVIAQARELGGEKAVEQAQKELDVVEAMRRARERSNERNKEYNDINEWSVKQSLKDSEERRAQEKRELDAAEKSLNYLDKYRQDMDIITEQIALKNDGVYRTAEQQLMENARLQLTKKYNEEIVKIKNLDNLTEQGKLNAIAAANIKYQEQLGLVAQINAQRQASQKDLVGGIKTGAGKYFEEVSNLAAFTEDATTRALRGMEDMLVSFVQTGKLSFRDLANSIIADLIRIQMRQMITAPLAGLISGSIGNSFSPIVPGTSSLSASSADIMGRRAMGGPVTGGNSYLVGENGPEIFTPGASGGITPNNQISGGGVTVVQTINVTTGVQQTVRAEIMNLMPQIAASAKSAVADAKLRGGSYASALR